MSEIKAATRIGKDLPFGERVVYSSSTSSLMKRHMARGRDDSRRILPGRKRLHEMQVPLVQSTCPKKRREDAGEGFDAFGLERMDVDPALDELRRDGGFFIDCGDREWPVRADVISSFALDYQVSERTAGLRNVGRMARDDATSSHMVYDKQDITDDTRYAHRFCCSEAHRGLCATADAAVYNDAVKLARNLERALDESYVHRFLAIIWQPECPAGAPPVEEQMMCLYLSRKRERRMHCQITHCFISCVIHEIRADVHTISFRVADGFEFDFCSVWELAKEMLYGKVQSATVVKMSHEPGDPRVSSRLRASLRNDGGRVVWPGTYRRPRPPPQGPPDIPDEPQDPPPPKRRSKPMKVHPYKKPAPLHNHVAAFAYAAHPRVALVAQC